MVFIVFKISRNLSFAKSCKDITINCQNCFEIIHNISNIQSRVLKFNENKPLGVYMGPSKPHTKYQKLRQKQKAPYNILNIYTHTPHNMTKHKAYILKHYTLQR